MKIEFICKKQTSCEKTTKKKFIEDFEVENFEEYEEKIVDKNTKILVISRYNKAEVIIEIEKNTKIKSPSFGDGLTSDECILFDDNTEEIIVIYDEPQDITNEIDDYYSGKFYDVDYVLIHN